MTQRSKGLEKSESISVPQRNQHPSCKTMTIKQTISTMSQKHIWREKGVNACGTAVFAVLKQLQTRNLIC